jgi:hypothetical protein
MYDVTVDFPKFKVGVATRDGVVTSLKYRRSPSIALERRTGQACGAATEG